MKIKLLLILIVLFSSDVVPAIGQHLVQDSGFINKKEANNKYENGLKQGKWIEYYDYWWQETTKNKAFYYSLLVYKDGKLVGKVRDYYSEGKIYEESIFISGEKNGVAKWFYRNGQLSHTVSYENGKKQGMEIEYSENGNLWLQTFYKDDKKQGIEKEYDVNGKVVRETTYVNDVALTKEEIQKAELEKFKIIADKYRALETKPSMPEEQRKYIVQATTLNEDKNYSGAIELYRKAIAIDETYPDAHFNIALLLALVLQYDDAIFEMKKYLLLAPDASDARAAQDKIYEWEIKTK